jgi:hypothetical protein
MEQELKQKIWSALEKIRVIQPIDNLKILELIGEIQGINKLEEILNSPELLKAVADSYSLLPPVYVYNFINEFYKNTNPVSIFDPWLTYSSPSLLLKMNGVKGFCRFQPEYDRINRLFPENKLEIIVGDALLNLEKIEHPVDLILSFPPAGMKIPRVLTDLPSSNYLTNLIIKCKTVLTNSGKMVFLASPSILSNINWKALIKGSGLYFDAVFLLPSGTFLPQTNLGISLVIITKQKNDITFIAELSPNEKTNQIVFNNYIKKRKGKVIQLGVYVDINEFTSLRALIFEKETQELVKNIGYPPKYLTEIALTIKAVKHENAEEIPHLPNSIYLPKIGNSPVVSDTSSMKINPKNYYQIQLDESVANAVYVANYFNSEIGKKLRISLEVGSTIPQIPKAQLNKCVLYLPEIFTQTEIIKLDNKIDEFGLRLDELKRKLWKQPRTSSIVSNELKNINQEDRLEKWIDTLPFPISSILWRYYATKDNGKKIEHLFHYFEAFSEFLAMIMLSSLLQDKEFYKQECHKWIGNDGKFRDWYLRADFGSWVILTARISKTIREYLADKNLADFCKNIFGNPNDAFLNIITSKSVVRILDEVRDLRNNWKGHSGLPSEEEKNLRVLVLEQKLTGLRKCIADGFEDTKILKTINSFNEDGINTYTAKELIGARTPFNEITFQTLITLDNKKLYMYHSNQNKPIELLPFIKYIEASDAIYYYSSIESKDARWVSYHFDKQSEIKQPADKSLFDAFDFLKSVP